MQNPSDIEQKVKAYILNEFLPGEDPAQLTNTTPLITAGVLDSIATLKLVGFLEQEFSISVEAHEADSEHLDTIERIVQLVASKKGN
ncbi:MAG TPA: acyl carrier protein [Verrucomicrobiota bacterium]|nr:acyl carrier protein [Verrucomicrobiota bacterium]